ncbi:MAG: hypothetical protein AB7N80_09185 [Bdellovibrionales bacterium]
MAANTLVSQSFAAPQPAAGTNPKVCDLALIKAENPKVSELLEPGDVVVGFNTDGKMYIIADGKILAAHGEDFEAPAVSAKDDWRNIALLIQSSAPPLAYLQVTEATRLPSGLAFKFQKTPEIAASLAASFNPGRWTNFEFKSFGSYNNARISHILNCAQTGLDCPIRTDHDFFDQSKDIIRSLVENSNAQTDQILIVGDVTKSDFMIKVLKVTATENGVEKTIRIGQNVVWTGGVLWIGYVAITVGPELIREIGHMLSIFGKLFFPF